MQNLAMKRSAVQALIKELALMPEEDKEGGLHNAQGIKDSHEAGATGEGGLPTPDPSEKQPPHDLPSGDEMPKEAEVTEDQTVPAETEALEAVKGVDLDHDNEIEDIKENNDPIVPKQSITDKMKYDDLSLDELKKVKAALQAKGLL